MKTCKRCLLEKESSNFYKWKPSVCKDCHKKNDRERYEKRKKYLYEYKKKYYSNPKNKERHYLTSFKHAIEWTKRHPLETEAYNELRKALDNGKIEKPKECSKCNKINRIEGHHPDYTKPLEVLWLCRSCHKIIHRDLP